MYTAITTHRLLAVTGLMRAKVRTVGLPLAGATLQPSVGAHVLNLVADDGTPMKLTLRRPTDVDALIQLGAGIGSAKPPPTLEDLLAGGLFTPDPAANPQERTRAERQAPGDGTSQAPPSQDQSGAGSQGPTPRAASPHAVLGNPVRGLGAALTSGRRGC